MRGRYYLAHISSDLEGLCDDVYMIDDGKIVMHTETDILLSDYGLLKVTDDQYQKLEKEYIIRHRKEVIRLQLPDGSEAVLYGELSGPCH